MNALIEELMKRGLGSLVDKSRDTLAQADEVYLSDRKAEKELEQRYENLDLTREQRLLINDYMACASTANHRYAAISYIAGIKDTVRILVSLGLVKGIEGEQ